MSLKDVLNAKEDSKVAPADPIDWTSLDSERSVEIPYFLDVLKKIKPKELLDVGFAGGFYHQEIIDMGITFIGLDNDSGRLSGDTLAISEDDKARWRNSLHGIEVLTEDIIDYKTSRTFDMVASISVIEHIVPGGYNGELGSYFMDLNAVESMKKLISSKGYLLLTFPIGETSYFYSPQNTHQAQLSRDPNFHKGSHDVMFYDEVRVKQLQGNWQIEDIKYWVKGDFAWEQVSKDQAFNTPTSCTPINTCCALLLRNPK